MRAATLDDAERILALEVESFGVDAWSEGLVNGAIEAGHVHVGSDGYVVVRVVDDTADLDRIAVEPGSRRRGIGRALLGEAIALAARHGADRMVLEVADDNEAAVALYRDSGFAEIHRRPGYYGRGVDAIVMERALDLPGEHLCT